mmetsp:Transcript_17026/g.29415  ORF Transcript_17026/g.29415 Transcript_17026/m.29415 type:complete len:421 (+) Transcript_17026:121-1383(+)
MCYWGLALAFLGFSSAAECQGRCEKVADGDEVFLLQHSSNVKKFGKARLHRQSSPALVQDAEYSNVATMPKREVKNMHLQLQVNETDSEIGLNKSDMPWQRVKEPIAPEAGNSSRRGTIQFLLNEIEFELSSHGLQTSKKSKVFLAVLEGLALPAFFGVDRCYMGQITIGIIKGITLGGIGIWACIDYIVILINMSSKSESINCFGFTGIFTPMSIDDSFKFFMFFLILKAVLFWLMHMRCSMKTPSDSVMKPVEVEPQATKNAVENGSHKAEHPDFSGNWVMTAYEGDADRFLYDVGFGWTARKLARLFRMGVHKTKSEIVHDLAANSLVYVHTDVQDKKTKLILTLNASEQHYLTSDGQSHWASPSWIEGGQKIKGIIRDEKGPLPTLERWLVSPTEMRVRLTTAKGNSSVQVYTKQY